MNMPRTEGATFIDSLLPVSDLDQYLFIGPVIVPANTAASLSVEAGTVAGDSGKLNEDTFAVRRSGDTVVIALFDGATSLKKIPAHDAIGMSGARFASHFLRDSFLKLSEITEHTLRDLNRMLRTRTAEFEGLNPDDVTTVPTSTATIAIIDGARDRISLQHIGDSFAAVRDNTGRARLLTPDPQVDLEDGLYREIQRQAKERGITNREARDLPDIREGLINKLQSVFNRPNGDGFGVVNGDPLMDQYIFRLDVPLSSVDRLLIASDGLPAPDCVINQQSGIESLLSLIEKSGIQGAIDFKKEQEDRDPDWEIPRWKHSDDATAVVIKVSHFPL